MKYFNNIDSFASLKSQYRTLAIANHPDRGGSEQATAKLKLQVEKKLTPIKDKIQSFDLISFRGQQGNYVGEWVIRTEDARYIFKTSCILAGGYNIQCLHARYIANLKQVKK